MLETVLTHLHNWFPTRGGRHAGTFSIVSGMLFLDFSLLPGQYYRIRGSAMNDGLHQYGNGDILTDETFSGEVWALAVPRAVVDLSEEIAAWREKNPETDKVSESFGGYSYTRGGGGTSSSSALSGWQGVFSSRLNAYRRPYDD